MKILAYIVSSLALASGLQAAPLTVDLTKAAPEPVEAPLEGGTNKNPKGETITADSRSFFLNGKPWIPVAGEIHFSRYPHAEWREALRAMKAGGIEAASTYVFWICHEEVRGTFDWTGDRNLREFIQLCQEVGLKAIVRIGPHAHGEARNGGFPDWVQRSGVKLRSTDPAYLALAKPLYAEISKQLTGLLWKDGGPVIAVQVDNESNDTQYLLTLKEMARKSGIDVPVYTMTGWSNGVPEAGLLPMFGGYSDGFWGQGINEYRREFRFTIYRDFASINFQKLAKLPYATAEIGAGMTSANGKRIKVVPSNISALALAKLGSGNNLPGYYMYHGGIQADGKLSPTHQDGLPVKDYDFQTALGAFGQIREQYHLLRQQHLFIADFGASLARMTPYLPALMPKNLTDFETLNWCVRSDGTSGYIFYSNQQPYIPLPDHRDIQFSLKTNTGTYLVPEKPISIPSGSHGILPFHLDCDGVMLEYATAQLLCKSKDGSEHAVYFFTAVQGVEPELLFGKQQSNITVLAGSKSDTSAGTLVGNIKQGTTPAATVANSAGKKVSFVILDKEQGKRLWRARFAGGDYVVLSGCNLVEVPSGLRFTRKENQALAAGFFPQIKKLEIDGSLVESKVNGVFSTFSLEQKTRNQDIKVGFELLKEAGPEACKHLGTEERIWNQAATYKLSIPQIAEGRHILLNIHYIGNMARVYVGDKLFMDHFYNGDPLSVGLWRIPSSDWDRVTLKILPYSDALAERLPQGAKMTAAAAKEFGTLNQIRVDVEETLEAEVKRPR